MANPFESVELIVQKVSEKFREIAKIFNKAEISQEQYLPDSL